MSSALDAADCVGCTWACSTMGTDFGSEKVKTLALEHFHACEADCVLLKTRSETGGDESAVVEEVIGQVNRGGVRLFGGVEVTA